MTTALHDQKEEALRHSTFLQQPIPTTAHH